MSEKQKNPPFSRARTPGLFARVRCAETTLNATLQGPPPKAGLLLFYLSKFLSRSLAPGMQLPTPDDLAIIDQTFADRNIGGFVDGNTAREVFMASQLPNDVLSAIWRLSDTDGDSQLSHLEFRIGKPARTPD